MVLARARAHKPSLHDSPYLADRESNERARQENNMLKLDKKIASKYKAKRKSEGVALLVLVEVVICVTTSKYLYT